MKISLNWLKTFVDITQTAEELEQLLTGTGLEVEHYETVDSVKGGMKGLIVGQVTDCIKHPNADKLSLTKVDTGNGSLLTIVCGAPNVATGQKVIVAPVGTVVHPVKGEPFTIQKAKIRGEASEGMLCAEDEIGLGASHAGLLILPENLPLGSSVADYFKVTSDVIFEIGLTANRGDAASHLGVAREIATVLNLPLKKPVFTGRVSEKSDDIELKIEDASACMRYSGLVIKGVEVKESPGWLKARLKSIGVNTVNNIVDATNFVMFDLGQPLHAFDLDKIKGQQIRVRRSVEKNKFIALDEKEYTLNGQELMISDKENDLCLAGVYGGKDSGVSEATKNIFLESAFFSADVVRKTAKRHGLSTDSAFRFERGTDPEMTLNALQRVSEIIAEIAGGKVAGDYLDIVPEKLDPFAVTFRYSSVEKICGFIIPEKDVERILKGLEIVIVSKNGDAWQLQVPLFKSDVTRETDVVEELVRIYGFNHIPLRQHLRLSLDYQSGVNERVYENRISDFLKGMGFSEIMTNSLSNDQYYEDKKGLVYLANPLSAEMNVMRRSMLYSGLEAIAYNKNRKQGNTHFYEFGKTYLHANDQYFETEQLVIFASGYRSAESWETKQQPVGYYFLKSVAGRICVAMGTDMKQVSIQQADAKDLKLFDIKDDVFYAVINWQNILSQSIKKPFSLKPLPQFPVVRRDLSLVVGKETEFKAIQALVNKLNIKHLTGMNVFDVYEGKPLEEGKKAISISFELYDEEKTMNDKEIDQVMQKLIKKFEENLDALIRK